jgi:hypothetical protein
MATLSTAVAGTRGNSSFCNVGNEPETPSPFGRRRRRVLSKLNKGEEEMEVGR